MPAQLLERLNRFLDQQHATTIMALENVPRIDNPPLPPPPANPQNTAVHAAVNTVLHWPRGGFGNRIADVQCVMIYETSGSPSYASANNFVDRFSCRNQELKWRPGPPATPHLGRWVDDRGIGPQYYVDPWNRLYADWSAKPRGRSARDVARRDDESFCARY